MQRVSPYLHHLLRQTHHQLNRNGGDLIYTEGDAFLNVFLKSGCSRFQTVVAHGQKNQKVGAVGLTDRFAVKSRFRLDGGNLRMRNDGAAGVSNHSADAARYFLRPCTTHGQQQNRCEPDNSHA